MILKKNPKICIMKKSVLFILFHRCLYKVSYHFYLDKWLPWNICLKLHVWEKQVLSMSQSTLPTIHLIAPFGGCFDGSTWFGLVGDISDRGSCHGFKTTIKAASLLFVWLTSQLLVTGRRITSYARTQPCCGWRAARPAAPPPYTCSA